MNLSAMLCRMLAQRIRQHILDYGLGGLKDSTD